MKKLIVILIILSGTLLVYLAIAGSGADYDKSGVRYLSAQSSVINGMDCSLCFENSTDKPLEFCVYGVFDDERSVGLDENGKLKSVIIQPHERQNFVFRFKRSTITVPGDVVIIGEYK